MDDTEMKAIAGFLVECEEALYEQGDAEALMLYLNRLYEVIRRLRAAGPATSGADVRFLLAILTKKARTLRRAIEEQLGVRN